MGLCLYIFTFPANLSETVHRRPTADPIFILFPASEFIEAVKPISALQWTAVASALKLWLEVWGQYR